MTRNEEHWYVAELVVAISVGGHSETLVHRNLVLVRAENDDAAYEHALEIGRGLNDSDTNPEGRSVRFEFLGLGDLAKVHDELEDGTELCFTEKLVPDKESVQAQLPTRERLTVFRAPAEAPLDYRSREVVEMMGKLSGKN